MSNKTHKEIIYVIPKQLEYLIRIYSKRGVPLPGSYVSGNTKNANYIVNYPKYDIGLKTFQTYFKHLPFYPKTFFPGEKIKVDNNRVYFYKEHNKENCEGISLFYGRDLPEVVPLNIIIQEEIKPYLYNGLKFAIRVLCSVRRDGYIYFYRNLFYNSSNIKAHCNIRLLY